MDVIIMIKNTYPTTIGIQVVGVPEYVGLPPGLYIDFPENSINVDGGAIHSFNGSFTMPDRAVTIHAYSYWYGADGNWYFDDEMTAYVALAVLTPQVSEFRIADFYKV